MDISRYSTLKKYFMKQNKYKLLFIFYVQFVINSEPGGK